MILVPIIVQKIVSIYARYCIFNDCLFVAFKLESIISSLKLLTTLFQHILCRPIRFHVLAFFDPVIYDESLDTKSSDALSALDLIFSIDLVNSVNIYVRKYAEYRTVTPVILTSALRR